MPIYEYVCNTCGKEFEVMQKFSDRPLTRCTCSEKARVARKLSVPSFHLQGGGWYNEGYSGKKDGNGKAAEKSDAKSDTKSEAKAETKSGGAKAESSGSKSESSGSKKEASSTKKEPKKSSAPTASA